MQPPPVVATPSPGGPPLPVGRLAPFAFRDFQLLCVTQLAGGIRGPMLFIIQAWYVNVTAPEDQRLVLLGLLATLRGAAFLGYVLFGGVLADRYPRRTMLLGAHIAALLFVGGTGALLYLPGASTGDGAWLPLMMLLFAASGLINAQDLPTRTALVSEAVPPPLVTRAVTLFQLAWSVSLLIAGPVTGLAIDHLGFGTSYLIAASTHVWLLIAVWPLAVGRRAADPDAKRDSMLRNLRDGFAFLGRNAGVRWTVLTTWAAIGIGITVMGVLMAAWLDDVLALGATGWGVMQLFWGGGGLLAMSWMAARRGPQRSGWLLLVAALILGGSVLAFSLSRIVVLSFILGGFSGGAFQTVRVTGTSIAQTEVPPELRGRVLALLIVANGLAGALGVPAGLLAQFVGLEALFTGGGVLLLALAIGVTLTQRQLRAIA
jgi:MFS family permease